MFENIKDFRNGLIELFAALPLLGILNLLNMVMLAAVVLAGLGLVRQGILEKLDTTSNAPGNVVAVSLVKSEDFLAYAIIGKNNPFGGKSKELWSLYRSSLDTTQLIRDDFVLVGTMVGSLKQLSYAIFKTKGATQEVVALKSEIPGVGVLDEVNRNQVFIKRGDTRFSMLMKDDQQAGVSNNVVMAPIENGSGVGSRVVDRGHIVAAIENPVSILTDARINPVAGGKGFVLSEVKTGGFYDALGLNNGDTLIDIDGHEISRPEEALKMVTAIKGMDTIRINIVRNNKPESLEYFIK